MLFCLFLAAPMVAHWLGWNGGVLHENRNLTPFPNLAKEPVAAWPGKLEAYYDDSFGFRAALVRIYNALLHKYLRASNSDVVIGNDGWIFYAREDIFKDFFGKAQFTDDELQRWKEHLESRQAALSRAHCRYLFVIAPDKNTIYPEELPGYIRKHRGRSRVQQLREYLRQTGSPVDVLDLHDAMLAAKPRGVLFFPQDTHWNGRGYFVGYEAMCAALARWFPGVKPQILGRDYTLRVQPWPGGEWTLFGLTEENLRYRSEFLVPTGTQQARKPVPPPVRVPPVPDAETWKAPLYWDGPGRSSALIFHDSYMRVGLLDREQVPLAEHFAKTLLVGRDPSDADLKMVADLVHPDVVIEEHAERMLRAVPPRSVPRAAVQASGPTAVQPTAGCAAANGAVDLSRTDAIEAFHATLARQRSGLVVTALEPDAFLMLPPLPRQSNAVFLRVAASGPAMLSIYAIAEHGQDWVTGPIRAQLHAGSNEVLLPIPESTARLRLDPGDRKLTYTIQEISYASGCKSLPPF